MSYRDVRYHQLHAASGSCSRKFGHVTSANTQRRKNETDTIHPLFDGIYQNDYVKVSAALESMTLCDLNSLSYAGQTLLHAACLIKSSEILQLVLKKGVKTGIANSVGETPLHTAAAESWQDGVEELLKYGASPNAMTEESANVKELTKQTPLHVVTKNASVQIVLSILQYNPDLTLRDNRANTLLHMAAMSHSSNLIQVLLSKEECLASIQCVNDTGDTPLHSLLKDLCRNHTKEILKCAKIFVSVGSDVNSRNMYGETCVYLACRARLPEVVEYLLTTGANPALLTRDGKSTIHASCMADNGKALKILLNTNAVQSLIMMEDNEGQTPFHKAVDSFSIDCCELLLSNGEHLSNIDYKGVTRCSLILHNIPNAIELLTRVLDAHVRVSSHRIHDPCLKVIFDYSMLYAKNTCQLQNSLIHELTRHKRFESLLKHPLLESFLHIKWGRIQPFFYVEVLLFSVFLIIHTIFVMMSFGSEDEVIWNLGDNRCKLKIFIALYSICYIIIIVPAVFITLANGKKYLRQLETYSKVITLVTSAYLLFTAAGESATLLHRNIAAISLFFGWIEMMLLVAKFPTFGVYILMFTKISKSVIKFLISFSFLIIGFACAFEILFYDVKTFKNLPLTFLRTMMMMAGEIDYSDIYTDANFSRIFQKLDGQNNFHFYTNDALRALLLTAFLFLIPILMANLLVGLAVSDIPNLQRQGKLRRLVKQATYIASYERLMLVLYKLNCFPCWIRKLLARRYTICQMVVLSPNRTVQHPKRHFRVPFEILREAIVIGAKIEEPLTKDSLCNINNDIETQLKRFQEKYFKDIRTLNKRLDKLTDAPQYKEDADITISLVLDGIRKELQSQRELILSLTEKKITVKS